MPKLPFNIMEIPSDKFLSWRLLGEILHDKEIDTIKEKSLALPKHLRQYKPLKEITRGGKTFSAARRGTENPPCVLVSLAVNVLQK
jgi:hypothetical protein